MCSRTSLMFSMSSLHSWPLIKGAASSPPEYYQQQQQQPTTTSPRCMTPPPPSAAVPRPTAVSIASRVLPAAAPPRHVSVDQRQGEAVDQRHVSVLGWAPRGSADVVQTPTKYIFSSKSLPFFVRTSSFYFSGSSSYSAMAGRVYKNRQRAVSPSLE